MNWGGWIMEKMTSKEAIEILRAMQHAKELLTNGAGVYGRIVTEHTRNKEIEALDYAIKLQDKIDYKIESLEEELKILENEHLKNEAVMRRIYEIVYALEVLKC